MKKHVLQYIHYKYIYYCRKLSQKFLDVLVHTGRYFIRIWKGLVWSVRQPVIDVLTEERLDRMVLDLRYLPR